MRKLLFAIVISILSLASSRAENYSIQTQSPSLPPLREMRAVWLTTIGGIDWPHSYAQTPTSIARQQEELCSILDKLVEAGFNTVLLQTRVRATTIFPSDMEPWDGCLSGFPGKSPGYDALQFAVEECHKRGIKLHAWVVTIPVGKWNGTGCKALRNTYPELLKKIGDEGFMNPDAPGTGSYIASFCADITRQYDIDGIHLDYIRYPDAWKNIGNKEKGRENITNIVKKVSKAVKQEKPWVVMSCSPIGKYADTKRQWSHGWNARDAVCQDAALWLREGYMDALFPMMYFKGENFYPFAIDWKERSNGKIICPGLGIYFMHPREKNWPLVEITREMHVSRQYGMGTCLFRSKFFTDNTKGLYDYTKTSYSPQPSLQPITSHPSNIVAPTKPSGLSMKLDGNGNYIIAWEMVGDVTENEYSYNVYGSEVFPVDITKASNLLAANLANNNVAIPVSKNIRYFAVTTTNRYGMESLPAQTHSANSTEDVSSSEVTNASSLSYRNGYIDLSLCDVEDGQLLLLVSMTGITLNSSFAHRENGMTTAYWGQLPKGHYDVFFVNKKGNKHKIGRFSVPL